MAASGANPARAAAISWHNDIQKAARQSAAEHKPMLVMVKARWCGPCRAMLNQTLSHPSVAARVAKGFVPVLIDADDQASIVQSLGVESMPTVLVISPEQKITGRITGFQSAAQLGARLAPYAPREIRPGPRPLAREPMAAAGRMSKPPAPGSTFLALHAVDRAGPGKRDLGPAGILAQAERYELQRRDLQRNESQRRNTLAAAIKFSTADTQTLANIFAARQSPPMRSNGAGPLPHPPD